MDSTMKQIVNIDQLTPCHIFSQQLELKLTFKEKCTADHLNPYHSIRNKIKEEISRRVSTFICL
jgi:hypothetical protein